MNLLMFPRMLSSHDQGWAWLTRVHPSVAKMLFFYVLPMSLLAAAMLLYGATTYGGTRIGNLALRDAWIITGGFLVAELVAVPVMGAVIQRIGDLVDSRPAYQDAFAFAAVVPTPLWLASLALFVPSLMFNAGAMAVALFASGLLIFEGSQRIFQQEDEGQGLLLSGAVLAAGLVAWVVMMGLGFVAWGGAIG
jgi:hypothetical protein